MAIEAELGVTVMELRVAVVTASDAVPLIVLDVAVMVTLPSVTPVATPVEAIVAMELLEEVQAAVLVRFCVVPSV